MTLESGRLTELSGKQESRGAKQVGGPNPIGLLFSSRDWRALALAFASLTVAPSMQAQARSGFNTIHSLEAHAGPLQHQHDSEAVSPSAANAKNYTLATGNYIPPSVTLVARNGEKVQLADLLAQPRPVLLEFIFTSCGTICPVLSATLSQAQGDVGRLTKDYVMISISIDPEYDTPGRLDIYARRYHPGNNWYFLTGTKQDILRVRKAFNALSQSDNKMYHRPYTYLRARATSPWVRLEGYPSVAELLGEYRGVLHAAGTAGN